MRIKLSSSHSYLVLAVALGVSSVALPPTCAQEMSKSTPLTLGDDDFKVNIIIQPAHLIAAFGPRFDNTAMVSQVTLNGKTYLSREGLTDEFGIDGTGVLGFREAQVGGRFLKIGVGELVRNDLQDYGFWHSYKLQKLLPVSIQRQGNSISVYQIATLNPKYGYEYCKSYQVDADSNSLSIEYSLKNTGKRSFRFTHYNHNWFAFSGRSIGPLYSVSTGFPVNQKKLPEWLRISNSNSLANLHITQPIQQGVVHESGLRAQAKNNWFRVECDGSNQQVEVRGVFNLHKFVLYAEDSALCPESFVQVSLKPGQVVQWTREYQFSNSKTGV